MASSLSAQLKKIAAGSTDALNLKAQKAAHGKSLIYEPRIAASQSFDTLYTICHEGFEELCLLDSRFLDFKSTLFSEQSQEQERTLMTKAQNSKLDHEIEKFLGLVGSRIRLNPAIKAVEWIVRRFRAHEYNTAFLITTLLPYHTLPIFTTLLSILPTQIPTAYKFLYPYIRSLTTLPRHTIVHSAINNSEFTQTLCSYVLRLAKAKQHYPALLSFWAGVMVEAVSGMMDKARSGIKNVQLQEEDKIVKRLIPTLNEGLAAKRVPELRIGCYMIIAIMASKGGLDDTLLTAMMEAVVLGWTSDSYIPGLVCLSILAQQRLSNKMSATITKALLKVDGLVQLLVDINQKHNIEKLASGICVALLTRLSFKGDASVLPIVEAIVTNNLLTHPHTTVVIKSCLAVALRLGDNVDPDGSARLQMASTLNNLADQPDELGQVVRQAMQDSNVDLDHVELRLNATVRPKALSAPQTDVTMDDAVSAADLAVDNFETLFSRLPTRTVDEVSFLSHTKSHIYDDLCQAFVLSITTPEFVKQMEMAPLLQKESAMDQTLYFSFFIKVWCGPSVVLARSAALQIVTRTVLEQGSASVDLQGLIPYLVVALGDPAHKVRQAAAGLATALVSVYAIDAEGKKKKKSAAQIWGSQTIYGSGVSSARIEWLSRDHAAQFVASILQPALEACVLDRNHINSVIEKSLNSHSSHGESPRKTDAKVPSQSLRLAVLTFLASHVVNMPLYFAKLRLLKGLNLVKGVASTTRTKLLGRFLIQWSKLTQDEVNDICVGNRIDAREFDREAMAVVLSSDQAGLELIKSVLTGSIQSRPNLISAAFTRYEQMWPFFKPNAELAAAKLMMEIVYRPVGDLGSDSQAQAMHLLRTVPLSTGVLEHFLSELPTAAKLADKAPSTKRRRVSHGEVAKVKIQDSAMLTNAIAEVTFVLELIDGSEPEKHVELLRGLFNTLAELQHFKLQVGSELAYLQGLVLTSLLSIMGTYKANKSMTIDSAGVRADLLVDCVQKTASPQVQNSALLLIASLASAAPALVLHSVMPIFTFMGSSVLRQNDEYSAHVIKQTINEVIPPLILSLRKTAPDLVTGAAELLLSFVAAYEHVPVHRRKGLYTSLVQTLNPDDFLYAMLAMLVDKYGCTDDIRSFAIDLTGSFNVQIQLSTAIKYLRLVEDVLSPKPTASAILLSVTEESSKDPKDVAAVLLELLPNLLSHKRLVLQTSKTLEKNDMESETVREYYAKLLEMLLVVSDSLKEQPILHNACGVTLENLLSLLTTGEFVKSIESLLDRPNIELKRKILRSMELRITQENQFNVVARQAMLAFLPRLISIIRRSEDVVYKIYAVSCVDKIAEKFGKMDLAGVAATAETIVSLDCLGQSSPQLRIRAILCLSSLVDILREGIVAVLPVAIGKTLAYLRESVSEAAENVQLHNACYSFLSSLLQHLPYMISAKHLKEILNLSCLSSAAALEESADQQRSTCLNLAAKQIDIKVMFTALDQNWDVAVSCGSEALLEYIGILSTSIERHTKSNVTKHSAILSSVFRKAFDVRRTWTITPTADVDEDDIDRVEEEVNAVAIKMIYKFNDSTFRPIFAGLIEWGATGLPKNDKRGRVLRLQTLYGFMITFFSNLKSIVTNYATYILDNVVDILSTVNPRDDESKRLWSTTLSTLAQSFSNDQDDFWQSPSHFSTITPVLISQFTHASSLPLLSTLIPCIVELASAADSADHHKELNTSILKHMRSETVAVRLAAVQCQQALTDRLGEEWLSMLPEMLPFISEAQEDDDEVVERETHRWIVRIEGVLGESLDEMLQ